MTERLTKPQRQALTAIETFGYVAQDPGGSWAHIPSEATAHHVTVQSLIDRGLAKAGIVLCGNRYEDDWHPAEWPAALPLDYTGPPVDLTIDTRLRVAAMRACTEQGLAVMWHLFEILLDREVFDEDSLLMTIAEVDLQQMYEAHIGPAIDMLEKDLITEGVARAQ